MAGRPVDPHPQEQEIRALLAQGLTNNAISRRLFVGPRAVARIRETAGIPPVPRNAYQRLPATKHREILALLDEGYNDAAIGRRTGADVGTVARLRREGGFGRATQPRASRPHPRDAEIRALLRHMSNNQIALELKVDRAAVRRIRGEAGIAYVPPKHTSAEEKWAGLVREVDGGHLEWLGERAGRSGTPVMRFREKSVSPAGIAFTKRTGRAPVGQVRAECEFRHCVAPAHVDDEPGRLHVRQQLRAITGAPERPKVCRHGHDQAVHGRLEPDGAPYCGVCKRDQKRAHRARTT
ncbi:hypothetical protein [Streptomyces chryseus]|uniref:Uncharacterized protein n=1 Tax=Streptomyces chryseus TaxID=68186 RepID=A0ABQ3DP01_9ACTN|nr:hypothetical protein [Streptomyces chryseus]GHA94137.1 hypothetical protein GCM10010346_16090 [Streptomyces chryseus]